MLLLLKCAISTLHSQRGYGLSACSSGMVRGTDPLVYRYPHMCCIVTRSSRAPMRRCRLRTWRWHFHPVSLGTEAKEGPQSPFIKVKNLGLQAWSVGPQRTAGAIKRARVREEKARKALSREAASNSDLYISDVSCATVLARGAVHKL